MMGEQEEGAPPMEFSSPSVRSRPVAAAAYFSQDFEWESLRDEVQRSGFMEGWESETGVEWTQRSTREEWIKFHNSHVKGCFFKERRYLVKEFPELLALDKKLKVLEVGCGSGSSVLPVLRANVNALVYACDCSIAALERAQGFVNAVDPPNVGMHRFFPFYCDICIQVLPSWLCCEVCRDSFKGTSNMRACSIWNDNEGSASVFSSCSKAPEGAMETGKIGVRVTQSNHCAHVIAGNDIGKCRSYGHCFKEDLGSSIDFSERLEGKESSCIPVEYEESTGVLPKSSFCVGGVNIVMMVFTLSSIPPERMHHVIKECYAVLEPGGLLLFRDYGLYDMTMLRFPVAQRIGKFLFQRNDGTLSYYFSPEVLRDMFTNEGFLEEEIQLCCVNLMNRKKCLPMKRVWIHAKFSKPKL
eukprot:c23142_g1_i1 orf=30-1268(+)